ncbi:DUF3037 domain-containing protein [Noviherbaspirillum sp. Root189]|uniref:DUF3037 domain-containing protein n=1 Tax=Noviherbaspirillum sp. Root189 TaxID=1736487 RepID=UPI00070E58F4|nr:DUF3037 domain-containing protein [Noviherbaspirillum sp. Root189]KRB67818.1 hypothetical protein ASE07_09105 [Noviherbaspirillum sp. Root189]
MTALPESSLRYDYAIVRVVPRVERGEFMNVGVIVLCGPANFLACSFEYNRDRLRALDPQLDMDMLDNSLNAFRSACVKGDNSNSRSLRNVFDFLVATRSAVLQVSPVHSGFSRQIDTVVESLMARFVRLP